MKSKRIAVIVLIFVAAMIFSSCRAGKNQSPDENTNIVVTETSTEKITQSVKVEDQQEVKELDIEVLNNQNSEAVFSFSVDDFIDRYNYFYYEKNGTVFLRDSSDWDLFTYDEAPHSKFSTEYYRFRHDVKNYNEPTISVYVPENSRYVQEITLDFPEHSYTEWGYEMYKENCFYAFKVFFPDFDDEQIQKLYATVFDKVYDSNYYFNSQTVPSPKALYYKNNIGIYPYFRVGMLFIAIIPVTHEYLDALTSNNVEVYEIDDFI